MMRSPAAHPLRRSLGEEEDRPSVDRELLVVHFGPSSRQVQPDAQYRRC